MKFRTKPFEIDAVLFDGTNSQEIVEWTEEGFEMRAEEEQEPNGVIAEVWDKLHSTWVGVMAGQWIIKGQKGEFYPCDPEIFAAKYEAVDE